MRLICFGLLLALLLLAGCGRAFRLAGSPLVGARPNFLWRRRPLLQQAAPAWSKRPVASVLASGSDASSLDGDAIGEAASGPPGVMDVEDESQEEIMEMEMAEVMDLLEGGGAGDGAQQQEAPAAVEDDPLAWTDKWLGSLGLSREALADSLGANYNGELDLGNDGPLFDSRTLRALAGAGEASRSLLTKAQEELQALGAYAASKAAADSKLLLSVGVVVAAELAAYLARPLLAPSSSASVSASASEGGDGDSSSNGTALAPPTLSLKEKVELVQSGMLSPWELTTLALGEAGGGNGRGRFAVSSFADAGDPDALLMDMYAKTRQARGLPGLLPPLPKQLAALSLPLQAVASLPSLPGAALKALDTAKRLDVGAQTRRPTERLLQGVAAPILPTLEAWAAGVERRKRDDRLLAAGFKVGEERKWWDGLGVQYTPPRRSFSKEEEEAILLQLGVLGPRGGAGPVTAAYASGAAVAGVPFWDEEEGVWDDGAEDGAVPTVAVSRMGKRRRGRGATKPGSALEAAAAAVGGLLWEDEEEMEARVLRPVRRMMRGADGSLLEGAAVGAGDVEVILPILGAGSSSAAAMGDDTVLEARVEAVSPEEERRAARAAEGSGAKIGRLLLRGTLRALDVTLLGLEFLAVEALPVVAARAKVATRRAKEAVMPVGVDGGAGAAVGRGGGGDRDLLPVFERPMRSDLIRTRRR